MAGKYRGLGVYLGGVVGDRVTLRFAEVERIIGSRLPLTARAERAWWGNRNDPKRGQARVWMMAGWRRTDLDLSREVVTFERVPEGGGNDPV